MGPDELREIGRLGIGYEIEIRGKSHSGTVPLAEINQSNLTHMPMPWLVKHALNNWSIRIDGGMITSAAARYSSIEGARQGDDSDPAAAPHAVCRSRSASQLTQTHRLGSSIAGFSLRLRMIRRSNSNSLRESLPLRHERRGGKRTVYRKPWPSRPRRAYQRAAPAQGNSNPTSGTNRARAN